LTRQWYVLRTRPRSEGFVASALENDGFTLFFPRVRTPRRRQGYEFAPLFPRYLFLRIDIEAQDLKSVHGLPGVQGWVRFGGTVPSVPDEVVADLRQMVKEINGEGGLWTRFQPGDIVRVVSGKMDSLGRVLERPQSPDARVRVLLDFMGRTVSAQVPWHDLYPTRVGLDAEKSQPRGRRTRGRGRWIRGFGPRVAVGAYS